MSGGSRDYICYKIENELCGQMYDDELNDLMDMTLNGLTVPTSEKMTT